MPEETPWSKLYLPSGYREMIQSLVATQNGRDLQVPGAGQDLIHGKGR